MIDRNKCCTLLKKIPVMDNGPSVTQGQLRQGEIDEAKTKAFNAKVMA